MARPSYKDHLRVNKFWLMDVAPIEVLGVPIFTPLFGFSAITMPEIQVETHDILEGNWHYPNKVIKSASISTMTLSRGATFFDADFWRWTVAAIEGDTEYFQSKGYGLASSIAGSPDAFEGAGAAVTFAAGVGSLFGFPRIGGPSPRRDLILLQLFNVTPGTENGQLSAALTTVATAALSTSGSVGLGSVASAGLGAISGKFSRAPARAWQLKGCIPTRYKPGSDFEAASSDVSIMELDVEVEHIEEVSLAT